MLGARTLLHAALAASLLACASARGPEPEPTPEPDPWRPFNHAMFSVNDALDRFLVGPVAKGWIFVTPETVRVHLEQFYDNLNFPGYFVQPLLQGDPKQSGIALARFGVNSTAGLAGFFDPANHWLGLARRPEDMGQTFGVWGSGPGPYLVLPFLLPASSARDAAGFPIDSALNIGDSALISWVVPGIWPATLLRTINRRALADEDLRELREASFDWYSAVRDGYLQRREVLIRNDGDDSEEAPSDDLYELDESDSLPE
ncbi:MAG: VacJ family lipoprotein [Deltaproteobacteria bacterium]|nr:VacJ family lipoprotein [Deltaproteobacteria bacterium]